MITYVTGNIFTSPAKVLVNPVNTVGVMGKGLAKKFKEYFPDMFKKYQVLCDQRLLSVGKLWIYKTDNKWILNFPTKTTWRNPSELEYLDAGLKNFVNSYSKYNISSIAFPKLGCGNGELNWEDQVKPLMEKYLSKIPIMVFIYLNEEAAELKPEHKDIQNIEKWLRSEPACLTWDEVLNDVKREVIINNSSTIKDVIRKKELFINIAEQDISFEEDDVPFSIKIEDIKSLWIHVRDAGYFNKQTAPPAAKDHYSQILSLFLQLPYCKPSRISDNYSKVKSDDEAMGFLVMPPSSSNDLKNSKRENPDIHEARR